MTGTFLGFVTDDGKLRLDFPSQFKAYLTRFTGDEVELEIHKRREKRSLRQNAGFHAMITPWAHDEGHQIDELKRDLLVEIFGTEEHVNPITKAVSLVPVKKHTSGLTVQEFSLLIEETMRLAAECGCILVAPDEYRIAKEKAQKKAAKAA